MNATETRLKFEMEDALRSIAVFEREQAFYEQEAAKWKQHKKEAHLIYYRAKSELKTLNDKK